MFRISRSRFTRLALVPTFFFLAVGTTSCSFCVGSGCSNGTIDFGTSFKQDSSGGGFSIIGKTDTFTLGQSVAMVAKLSEGAGAHSISLEVSRNSSRHTLAYHVNATDSNVLANKFTPADLTSLGVSTAGTYTFRFLRGSKELAKGTMTEK